MRDFFKKHIDFIISNKVVCEECGHKLIGDVSEVAHILPKSYYKSIKENDLNVLYLCGRLAGNSCHAKYDNTSNKEFQKMKVFEKTERIFKELEREITEKITIPTYNRYQKDEY